MQISRQLNISEKSVGKYLKKFLPDYEKFLKNNLIKNQLEQMISLKKEYLTNLQIGLQLGIGEDTVRKYLKLYMPDYEKYRVNRVGRKKIRESKFKKHQGVLRKKFDNRKITSQSACIVSLCEPARNLLNDYLTIQEIRKNQKKITNLIKLISLRLFKLNRSRSPKLIFTKSIYLCTSLSLIQVSEILNISLSSISNLTNLIRLKKDWKKHY